MELLNLIHSSSFPIDRYRQALASQSIAPLSVNAMSEIESDPARLSVILLDGQLAASARSSAPLSPKTAIVTIGLTETPSWLGSDSTYLNIPPDPSLQVLLSAVKSAYQFLFQKVRADQLQIELRKRNQELEELNDIGIALSTVRDHQVLLNLILTKSRELSRSDAGSLYLLDESEDGKRVLRWKLAQNDSIQVDFEERVLPITKKSLAGFVALTGETLVIDDAYQLPEDVEYSINRSFDVENHYLTKSMLVFPMLNHVGGTIGVLQLINRKREHAPPKLTADIVPAEVIPFDEHTIDLMRSLAGQAAVAFENNLLYESIERLFEGFVTAAVTAIEQRDPTTSGHSFRVADLTVELARTLDRIDEGPFKHIRFSTDQIKEVRYASLLHDFGKVGVREQVLVKEKKLYPMQLDSIRVRFEFVMKSLEASVTKKKLDYLMNRGRDEGFTEFSSRLDAEMVTEMARLRKDLEVVVASNEPTVLPEGEFQYLQALARREFEDLSGGKRTLLRPDEAKVLSIRKGNLDAAERTEIESHVTHTFEFLSKIPWTADLKSVPDIAYAHHEKVNGRGYPRGLPGYDIPLPSRMMTISDIYDALTAKDRPYKRAIPTERALDILNMEVKDGLLDPNLVAIFIEAKVFQRAGIVRTT